MEEESQKAWESMQAVGGVDYPSQGQVVKRRVGLKASIQKSCSSQKAKSEFQSALIYAW